MTEEKKEEKDLAKKQLDDCIRDRKKRAWKEFTSELDPRDPSTKVWNTLKSMDGTKKQPLPEAPISGSLTARSARDKAELAVRTYATVSRVKVDRLKQRSLPRSEETQRNSRGRRLYR